MFSFSPFIRILFCFSCCAFALSHVQAQQVDSIYFNLYTDSLKKGTFNYINVEGKLSDGRYLPLGEKELIFSASAGTFRGNSLFIDTSFAAPKIKVKATLRSNPARVKEITIYIKRKTDNGTLPTEEEILGRPLRRTAGHRTNVH